MVGIYYIVIIFVYILIAKWVTNKVAVRCQTKRNKRMVVVAVALIFVLVPLGDEIAGRIYFYHLCDTKSGINVYKTIELPAEYWDKSGEQNFIDKVNGNLNIPLEQYAVGKTEIINRIFNIEERRSTLRDRQTNEVFSEQVWLMFWGGVVFRNIRPTESAVLCGRGTKRTIELYSKLFKSKLESE